LRDPQQHFGLAAGQIERLAQDLFIARRIVVAYADQMFVVSRLSDERGV